MIDRQTLFDEAIKSYLITYDNIWKIATGQGHDYITGYSPDYPYLKKPYRMITIDLSKQQALGANSKAIQQINFIGILNQRGGATIFFIVEEAKETILDFSQRTVRVFWIYFALTWCQYKVTQYNLMIQYNLNVKLPNSRLNKMKLGIKNSNSKTFIKYDSWY